MTFQAVLAAVKSGRADVTSVAQLAQLALEQGEEELALPFVAVGAERHGAPLLWQWAGLLHRALDEHAQAFRYLKVAADQSPADARIAHGLARVALEAGLDAVSLFERARALAAQDGDILIGLAAARVAAGDGEKAGSELEAILDRAPLWIVGHQQLAQLRSVMGQRDRASESLERALKIVPASPQLWAALFDLHIRREDFPALDRAVQRAAAAGVPSSTLQFYRGVCAGELEDADRPTALFARAPKEVEDGWGIWRIRHLLRVGRIEEAVSLIDQEMGTARAPFIIPYASLAWRLAGDPRSRWLEGDASLVRTVDLTPNLPPLERLAEVLRALHVAKGEYLDQSVRGGTQTDGPLFCRIEPEIRALRAAVVRGVEEYVAGLPPADPSHPLLGQRRDRRIRFAGSWSVRLRSQGHHSNHVHPQGWISSALYIALPQRQPQEPNHAGWLMLGEPHRPLRIDLPPFRQVEPQAGRLVLFPSWMWHGTTPFASGERLTVAFDVAPPR